MGDCDPERKGSPASLAERHAAQLHADVFCFDESLEAYITGAAVRSRGFVETQEREGGALCTSRMGAGRKDGELHAMWSDVWLA